MTTTSAASTHRPCRFCGVALVYSTAFTSLSPSSSQADVDIPGTWVAVRYQDILCAKAPNSVHEVEGP